MEGVKMLVEVDEGQKRKSARIAAIEATRRNKRKRGATSPPNDILSESHRRRGTKRKSLSEVTCVPTSSQQQQVGGEQKHEDQSKGNGDVPSLHPLPEMHFLENALNILQGSDRQNIFARPVDAEVENYHLVIKEPMDFSTLRAKLQEEEYKTLEEFEYDVLLISKNAMFFNGDTTMYHKQARAMNELSELVLNTLRTDPEKLEQLEHDLSKEKRQPARRGRGKVQSSPSSKQRVKKENLNQRMNQGDREINSGSRHHAAKKFIANRDSYKPTELMLPEIFSGPKALLPGDGLSIGYRESLMRFTKNLGPVAQRVAARKLLNMVPDYPSRSHIPASCFPETNFLTASSYSPMSSSFSVGVLGARGGGQGSSVADKGKNVISYDSIHGGQMDFGGGRFYSGLGRLAPETRGIRILGESQELGVSRERKGIYSGLESERAGGSHGNAANAVCIMESPVPSGEIIQPVDREFLRAFINDAHSMDQSSSTDVAGIEGFDSPVYPLTAVGDGIFVENQSILNQLGLFHPNSRTVNLSNPNAGITNQLHNQVLLNQFASGSRSNLLGATPRNIRSATKSSVYPSTYLRPSKFNKTGNSLEGLGSCSQTDGSLRHGYAASSAQMSPFVELSPPTMCNPQVVDGPFGGYTFGKEALLQQEYEPLGPYQKLLTLGEGLPDQEAQSAAATDMQPLPMVEWGQNATAVEDMQVALASSMETRDKDVNVVCKNSWVPRESITLGVGTQARSYPQRLGVDEKDLAAWVQQQQSQTAGPSSSQVHGLWGSTLSLDREAGLEQERQLMPPPGERIMFPATRTLDGRDFLESQDNSTRFEHLWRPVAIQQHKSLAPDHQGSKHPLPPPPPGF